MRILCGAVVGMVLLTGAAGATGSAQTIQSQQVPRSPTPPGLPPIDGGAGGSGEGLPPSVMARQAKARNDDRQKQLVADTNKLLQLATELKADVDKTNKDVLSVDVIKKADEIEKLAKSVKDRMKG